MAIKTGQIRCKRCFKNFEWYCVVEREDHDDVSAISEGKVAARLVQSNEDGKPDMIHVRCKYCAETNRFEHTAP